MGSGEVWWVREGWSAGAEDSAEGERWTIVCRANWGTRLTKGMWKTLAERLSRSSQR
jgi:hypothetical protein